MNTSLPIAQFLAVTLLTSAALSLPIAEFLAAAFKAGGFK